MYFFQYEVETTFSTFDLTHILTLIILFGSILFMVVKRNTIHNYKHNILLGKILGGFLLLLDITFYLWKFSQGAQPYFPVPMHLCSWATYIVVFSMFLNKKGLWHFALFYGFTGGLLSLLVPEFGGYSYDHLRFYQFFLLHSLILALPLYQYFVQQYKINYKYILYVIGFMYIQGLLALIVNHLLSPFNNGNPMNMMYVIKPPVGLPGILGQPIVYLLVFGILFVVLWYGLGKLLEKKLKAK